MNIKIIMPDFAKRGGLVTVVVQDFNSNEVLMVASTDKEGFLETLRTGYAVFFSTSRNKRWKKGETSGNTLMVHGIKIDCDRDVVIYLVRPTGVVCHEGRRSCFSRDAIRSTFDVIDPAFLEEVEVHDSLIG